MTSIDAVKVIQLWRSCLISKDYVLNTNYNITNKRYEDNDTDDQVTKAIYAELMVK